jgi:beta-lactamase superfamily II metal-dependent hydrolase
MRSLAVLLLFVCGLTPLAAGEADGRLDIYFIDVEGGAATLLVTPAGESILIDSGYPDFGGRDADRILHVIKDVANLSHLDHAVVSHWHLDHYGNHAALAARMQILNFWDRGIPDVLAEDKGFPERIANYRAATQNASQRLVAGDIFNLDTPGTALSVKVLSASGKTIANRGPANPFADLHAPQADDPSDNAASISLLWKFGKFSFLTCGDLTWNVESQLVVPNNAIGRVELFMVTHHGLPVSNNPALVRAIEPLVTVMCNGPTKGGHPQTIATLRSCPSIQANYQLHRNVALGPADQTPAEYIANDGPTEGCKGEWILASVAPDGNSFTVQIGPGGTPRTFRCRD